MNIPKPNYMGVTPKLFQNISPNLLSSDISPADSKKHRNAYLQFAISLSKHTAPHNKHHALRITNPFFYGILRNLDMFKRITKYPDFGGTHAVLKDFKRYNLSAAARAPYQVADYITTLTHFPPTQSSTLRMHAANPHFPGEIRELLSTAIKLSELQISILTQPDLWTGFLQCHSQALLHVQLQAVLSVASTNPEHYQVWLLLVKAHGHMGSRGGQPAPDYFLLASSVSEFTLLWLRRQLRAHDSAVFGECPRWADICERSHVMMEEVGAGVALLWPFNAYEYLLPWTIRQCRKLARQLFATFDHPTKPNILRTILKDLSDMYNTMVMDEQLPFDRWTVPCTTLEMVINPAYKRLRSTGPLVLFAPRPVPTKSLSLAHPNVLLAATIAESLARTAHPPPPISDVPGLDASHPNDIEPTATEPCTPATLAPHDPPPTIHSEIDYTPLDSPSSNYHDTPDIGLKRKFPHTHDHDTHTSDSPPSKKLKENNEMCYHRHLGTQTLRVRRSSSRRKSFMSSKLRRIEMECRSPGYIDEVDCTFI